MQETFTMSHNELNTLKTIEKIIHKRITIKQGSRELDITPRHLMRLKRAYLSQGAIALISKNRGKKNHRHSTEVKEKALSLIREYYSDYGPTLASEKLGENHDIFISKETLRQWMDSEGIRAAFPIKMTKLYQPRHRRACVGELVQMDGSPHDWFEGRAGKCTLLVLIDDATSQLLGLRFVRAETTFDYFDAVKAYLKTYGKPTSFYVDKHNVFNVNHKEAKSGDGYTQFGRALDKLGIELINANSPQAKGRVERANRTLQDRLVKELRYHNISSMEAANEFVISYIPKFNKRFAKKPKSSENAHIVLSEKEIDGIDRLFTIQIPRTISKQLTISYHKNIFNIIHQKCPRKLVGKKIMVSEASNGDFTLYDDEHILEYTIIKKYDFQERTMGVREIHAFLNQKKTNMALLLPKNEVTFGAVSP